MGAAVWMLPASLPPFLSTVLALFLILNLPTPLVAPRWSLQRISLLHSNSDRRALDDRERICRRLEDCACSWDRRCGHILWSRVIIEPFERSSVCSKGNIQPWAADHPYIPEQADGDGAISVSHLLHPYTTSLRSFTLLWYSLGAPLVPSAPSLLSRAPLLLPLKRFCSLS